MVTIVLLAFGFFGQPVSLEEIAERPLQKKGAALVPDGIGLGMFKNFYVWNEKGQIIFHVEAGEDQIFEAWTYLPKPDCYFVASSNVQGKLFTIVYDSEGNEIQKIPYFTSRFNKTDSQLYAFPISEEPPHIQGDYAYLFVPIDIFKSSGEWTIEQNGDPISKASEEISKHGFEHKDAWIIHDDNRILVMNELEPVIFTYKSLDLNTEKRAGVARPTNHPGTKIQLEGFNPLLEIFDPPGGVYKKDEFQKISWDWQQAHSKVVGFERFADGFLVAYEQPDCDPNGNCREPLLALQRLDKMFRVVGTPIVMSGIFAGVKGKKAYVIQFERPLTLPFPKPPFKPTLHILDEW